MKKLATYTIVPAGWIQNCNRSAATGGFGPERLGLPEKSTGNRSANYLANSARPTNHGAKTAVSLKHLP
jgi:hypothetical protein